MKTFKDAQGRIIGLTYKNNKYFHYSNLNLSESAFFRLSNSQKVFFLLAALAFSLSIFLNWYITILIFISFLTLLYFLDLLFNLFIIYRSFFKTPEIIISKKRVEALKNYDWPTYTILCPLYKEVDILPQFINAIDNLNYPKEKLEIILLLEKDDHEIIQTISSYSLPKYYQTLIIPPSNPKTKPKALNYGLLRSTAEFIVVYDAEDVPDPLQLKKVILAFEKMPRKTVCIQAKLNFYNPHQNMLTRLFSLEYSLWFDLVLTGLQSIHAPIPLGGTSNHFRTSDLKKLHGWDAFNVTEDADLGIRLIKKGYQTAVINSYTYEEANSNFANWFRQRSRWVKGYIQTYLVHTRDPQKFLSNTKNLHFITFQLIVGGKVLSMLINPLMWFITIAYFTFRSILGTFIESLFPPPIFYIGIAALFGGNFLYIYYYILGSSKRKCWDLIPFALLTPFYWLFMSIASYYALYELVGKPHFWQKTLHGMHLTDSAQPSLPKLAAQILRRRTTAILPARVSQ